MLNSKLVSALAVAGVALIGAQSAQAQVIKIDGSSTVYPITEAVAEEFQKAKKNAIKVTVGISGTGGGFKKFCRDETDFSNASRPITKSEMELCKAAGVEYIEMPVAYDALTVVINPKNAFLKQATVAEMKALWEPAAQGKITKWNQVNPAWPDAPVKLFGAGADSGTFEYFTEAMVGKAKSSRGEPLTRIRVLLTTLPRPSSASPSPAVATSPPLRTTTCWCKVSRATSIPLATLAMPTTPRTRPS